MNAWRFWLKKLTRRIWFRSVVYSICGVLLALVARFLAPLLPDGFESNVGQDAVGSILQILAASMLAVTTFSLTTMVGAYSGASQATPRSTQLLMADSTSQEALSTFLGAFLFSIVGIIALSTGYYGERGRLILFVGTLAVVLLIAITLLRWISHITGFGRTSDTINRVESATLAAIGEFRRSPHLGARPATAIPPGAHAIYTAAPGYVTQINVKALQARARQHEVNVHVVALPGTLVHPNRPLLWVTGDAPDDADQAAWASAFELNPRRMFDHDPRLGLIALSEIACRALPPTSNDYGTAIDAINALQRVFFSILAPAEDADQATSIDRNDEGRVFMPQPSLDDMVEDAFRAVARDGATAIEVMTRLCKALEGLAAASPEKAEPFRAMARQAVARASLVMPYEPDQRALQALVEPWA